MKKLHTLLSTLGISSEKSMTEFEIINAIQLYSTVFIAEYRTESNIIHCPQDRNSPTRPISHSGLCDHNQSFYCVPKNIHRGDQSAYISARHHYIECYLHYC